MTDRKTDTRQMHRKIMLLSSTLTMRVSDVASQPSLVIEFGSLV